MTDNNSQTTVGYVLPPGGGKTITVQFLVFIFLSINILLIVTFFSRDIFYTTMRYILFAVTLFSDSFLLITSEMLVLTTYFQYRMHLGACAIVYIFVAVYYFATPVTLTAMTLERYVAICIPLRHARLCTSYNTLRCIFIIHGISSIPITVTMSVFFASATHSMYTEYKVCSMNVFVVLQWQDRINLVVYQFYFLVMCIIIIFSYIEIMKVARAAAQENKKSTSKGLRTVALHAFQLLLCLIQLWCPFIETAIFRTNMLLYHNIRFMNYIIFNLAPKCLSPLIYGLRDEKFFLALKHKTLMMRT